MGQDKEAAETPAPMGKGMILICEKCGAKVASGGDLNPTVALRQELKDLCKEVFGGKQVRPVMSSCLDVCPDDKIAVALVPVQTPARGVKFFELPVRGPKKLAQEVLELAKTVLG